MKRWYSRLSLLAPPLALAGLMFQVVALDHWLPTTIEDVRGIEQTHLHAKHCHVAPSDCAGGATTAYMMALPPAGVPLPPALPPLVTFISELTPGEAPPAKPLHPPRAA